MDQAARRGGCIAGARANEPGNEPDAESVGSAANAERQSITYTVADTHDDPDADSHSNDDPESDSHSDANSHDVPGGMIAEVLLG